MSITEILDELPRLTAQQRILVTQRIDELNAEYTDEDPRLLSAIDEAD